MDSVVGRFFRERRYLGAADRRFISETTYGMLRNAKLLDFYVRQAGSSTLSPEALADPLHPLLHYTAHAGTFLREPASSIEEDIAPLWLVAFPDCDSGEFVRAVRELPFLESISQDPFQDLAIRYSLPEFVVQEWIGSYGIVETRQLCEASNSPAPITIRVNTLKTTVDECHRVLEREGVTCEKTRLSPIGLILAKRINVRSLAAFKQGFFEMQDEGSQLVSILMEPRAGESIVDACAGSGGKGLHMAALMNNRGVIYVAEIEEDRFRDMGTRSRRAGVSILRRYLQNQNSPVPVHLQGKMDGVLIDAPCSGTGTFRRNPGAKLELTEHFVERRVRTQRSILESYAPLVKPGGRLVYATCSLLRRENEEVMEWFLQVHPEFSLLPADEVLSRSGVVVSFPNRYMSLFPHRNFTDGFFAAVLCRTSSER